MTEVRRITLNVLATYGRSLFALVCGLFTSRWVLMSLGEVDYGLFGVIGGLMVFIHFINDVLAGAISRFFAVAIGKMRVAESKKDGLEECRRWFNTAIFVHTLVPVVLLTVGYPVGMWGIEHWLTVPVDRIDACIWVFRFVCISSFINMVNVPYSAMYKAKQYIAELTVYSVFSTAINVCFLYFMVTHPGEWLMKYAGWTCLLNVTIQVLIMVRARCVFPECRIVPKYWCNVSYLKQVAKFAGLQMLGCFCGLLRTSGATILVNKLFGPRVNAAQAVANSVNVRASSLSGAMLGAFTPAITTAYGAGEIEKMKTLALRACKLGALLAILFMIPLSLELPEIMRIWLKNPPLYATGLCWCMIIVYLVDVCTHGHMVVVNATGRIAGYHIVLSAVNVFTLPMMYLSIKIGAGLYFAIGGVLICAQVLNSLGRLIFAKRIIGMDPRKWMREVLLPLLFVIGCALSIGSFPLWCMEPSLVRILLTFVLTEVALLPCTWLLALDNSEREFLAGKLSQGIKFLRLRDRG